MFKPKIEDAITRAQTCQVLTAAEAAGVREYAAGLAEADARLVWRIMSAWAWLRCPAREKCDVARRS
jgi:hypothetical protein